ncbi:metal-sulfur cluster assembly factor [Candidatus Micrarchaeota archaeon]|nr:metal-sulfur cluster assembly factor [Candidatus Micrarchaeota archaeon]
MATVEQIQRVLKNVIDPELGINIVDLGLVYQIEEKRGHVHITATLTTPACPLGPQIVQSIQNEVKQLENVKRVEVEFTFDPPWNESKMSAEGKAELKALRQGFV